MFQGGIFVEMLIDCFPDSWIYLANNGWGNGLVSAWCKVITRRGRGREQMSGIPSDNEFL